MSPTSILDFKLNSVYGEQAEGKSWIIFQVELLNANVLNSAAVINKGHVWCLIIGINLTEGVSKYLVKRYSGYVREAGSGWDECE